MSFPTYPQEQHGTKLVFALCLRDRLTMSETLVGDISVTAGQRSGWRKGDSGTFLFFNLSTGPATLAVRSGIDTPYYMPVDIDLMLPVGSPVWPAYPDIALADPTLPLSDPGQPAVYRSQFQQCALRPAIAYPFQPGSTLLRGTVSQAGVPVAGATVLDVAGNALSFVTGSDGQFALVWTAAPLVPTAITVRTQRSGHPDLDTAVTIQRGVTTSVQINV